MNWDQLKDSIERIFYTAVSGAGAVLIQTQAELETVVAPMLMVLINAALVWLRRHLPGVPSPGDGLPGLPVDSSTTRRI